MQQSTFFSFSVFHIRVPACLAATGAMAASSRPQHDMLLSKLKHGSFKQTEQSSISTYAVKCIYSCLGVSLA